MKAKLIKTDSNYYLYVDGKIIASTEYVEGKQKLSKQNCDELFGVFDVESWIKETLNDADVKDELMLKISKMCLKAGFNKAMELNKDKVFTIEEMKAIFAFGHQVGMNTILAIQSQHSPQPLPKPDSDKLRDEVIQALLQPTEIEVTFIPDEKDSEGCLILKRVV